jgi:hypothetical protein
LPSFAFAPFIGSWIIYGKGIIGETMVPIENNFDFVAKQYPLIH